MSNLALYQRQQARLAAALVRYQHQPYRGLPTFGLAMTYERHDSQVQAVLRHKDGGEIESGLFPENELALAKQYVLGVG
jgi:hypothetical protein